jgi:hypothetical protein
MSLLRLLDDFSGSITLVTSFSHDEYPDDLPLTYESHKVDIQELWGIIRPKLRRDLEKSEMLDQQLIAMFSAFDASNKKLGRKIAWDIYNSKPEKLR